MKTEEIKMIKFKDKDWRYYLLSIRDIFHIGLALICFLVFIGSFIALIWSKSVSNAMLASSICVGIFNMLFIVSYDNYWEEDYFMEESKAKRLRRI